MTYLVNAFSLNMLQIGDGTLAVTVKKLALDEARKFLIPDGHLDPKVAVAIGHTDTAAIVGDLLGLPEADIARMVEAARTRPTVKMVSGDKAVVAQYIGPRLPEGTTRLPEEAKIEFFLVEL